MYACGIITALSLLTTSAIARPVVQERAALNSGLPFQVTDTTIMKVDGANTTLSFTVHDPDPLSNATSICGGTWKAGSFGFPKDQYERCGNSSFAWNMAAFTDINNFVLGIQDTFTDPSVGDPPYDQVTNFGKANVSEPTSFQCSAMGGIWSCEQKGDNVASAPIYATIAKK